jgi:Kef-type K+ transport system membrane component KefB/mannitol/fructose-specific phosphotransferase system IIA component (Ntr-type)
MPLLHDPDPLLTLAIVVLVGVASGALARLTRLPGITGQILAGIAMGPSVLHVFDHHAIDALQPLTHFALGLMAVTIGSHLSLRKLRGAWRRLAWLLLAESVVTPLFVFAGMWLVPGIGWESALLFGAIAVTTAPVTTIALVKETHSRGVFVKTLVAAVALNNIACIVLFELARELAAWSFDESGAHDLATGILSPLSQLGYALGLGAAATLALAAVHRLVSKPELHATANAAAILLLSGLSDYLAVSPLLSCMFLGMLQGNTLRSREKHADAAFDAFEPAILAVFFTLAGMHVSFEEIAKAGVVSILFFALRASGKMLSVRWAMRAADATENVRRYLGVALLPKAGISIGLVILLQDDPVLGARTELVDLFVVVVLSVVILSELIGPVATRWALQRAGEYGMDRTRLIDFLQEENIVVDLRAKRKEDAIARLVDHLIRSHHLDGMDREQLLRGVLEREAQASTCFGGGLAVPHCILPDDHPMVGVMGLSSAGLPFETPDGRPVHCMVLLGTSKQERARHLQVLAALARTVGGDEAFQQRLFHTRNAAHAAELLHGDDSESFNTFLDP